MTALIDISNAAAKLTLKEIRTASDDILVAFFSSDTVDVNEVDISNLSDIATEISREVTRNLQ